MFQTGAHLSRLSVLLFVALRSLNLALKCYWLALSLRFKIEAKRIAFEF